MVLPSHAARLTGKHSRCEWDAGPVHPVREANLNHEIWTSSGCPLCPQQILLFMIFWLQGMNWAESEPAGKRCDSELPVALDMGMNSKSTQWLKCYQFLNTVISSLLLSPWQHLLQNQPLDHPLSPWQLGQALSSICHPIHPWPAPLFLNHCYSTEPWPTSQRGGLIVLASFLTLLTFTVMYGTCWQHSKQTFLPTEWFNFFSKQNLNRNVIAHTWG